MKFIKFLKDYYRDLTPAEVIARELAQAHLDRLEAEGAVDCFQGKLKTLCTASSHPFWARSLENVLTPEVARHVESIIPSVSKSRLGGKHQSPKLERYRYYTAAWSSHPCHCKYRYEGFYSQDVGCIGDPNPPLRANMAEALNWL